jgi:hypothetical protein
MTADTRSAPLTPGEASAAASHAATTIDMWFQGSINNALAQAMFVDPYYRTISEAGKQKLRRELLRILAVAEKAMR